MKTICSETQFAVMPGLYKKMYPYRKVWFSYNSRLYNGKNRSEHSNSGIALDLTSVDEMTE